MLVDLAKFLFTTKKICAQINRLACITREGHLDEVKVLAELQGSAPISISYVIASVPGSTVVPHQKPDEHQLKCVGVCAQRYRADTNRQVAAVDEQADD